MNDFWTFVFNIETENTIITLPQLGTIGTYETHWGDGSVNTELSHTYTEIGEYTCTIPSFNEAPNFDIDNGQFSN
jgi:hypothetical protein